MFTNAPTMRRYVPCNTVDGVGELPELWEEESIHYQLKRVEIASSATAAPHKGTLFVTSKRVIFLGDDGKTSYDFDVPFITLHAVSRDPATYVKPCVYCQLDCEDLDFTAAEPDEEDGEEGQKAQETNDNVEQAQPMDDSEENDWQELFIVPEEEVDIMKIFDALSHAALLNPDEEDDEGNDDFIFNADELQNLGGEEARVLNHLESVFQFAGEDEEDEGEYEDHIEERANEMDDE